MGASNIKNWPAGTGKKVEERLLHFGFDDLPGTLAQANAMNGVIKPSAVRHLYRPLRIE